ncbi:MAG: NEW3 domain-containing protein [Actinomycetota bacterium]
MIGCEVTSAEGYAGNVQVECIPPPGWLCTLDKSQVQLQPGGAPERVQVEVQVAEGTPDGDYIVKIVARGDGIERSVDRIWVVRASGSCDTPCPNADGSPPEP